MTHNEGLSIKQAIEVAFETGIIVKIGLRGGFVFEDSVVERIWENSFRILLEADEATNEEPDRAVLNTEDVVYILFS